MRRYRVLFTLVFVLLPACARTSASEDRRDVFDSVWRTVNDRYFDPDFGGVDWKAVGERYRPLAMAAESDSVFYVRLNEMLFELGVSHAGVIPRDHPEWIGAPALFSAGGIGIDARVIDDRAIVTSVRSHSPAAAAGLRAGSEIESFGGETMEDIRRISLQPPRPPVGDDRMLISQQILQRCYGEIDSDITITYNDGSGERASVTLRRIERPGRTEFAPGLPPTFVEFESRRIESTIGYIRFNAFHPALLDSILGAIGEMDDAAGLVIDLRGNPGGAFPVRRAIAEHLVKERALFWRYRRRDGVEQVYLDPAERIYTGPLVILVDGLSASSSEEFSGAMQAIGRATIVGEPTPGICLIADIATLPDGSTLVYPVGETIVADGTVLEGRGVVPDVHVSPTREGLLEGRDEVLEAAVDYLQSQ